MTSVGDIPRAYTPPGGYGAEMPVPILAGCTDPLVGGAPDLRGTWKAVDARSNGERLPHDHPIWQHVERVEQAGDRVVVTSSGIVHDRVVDGTYENGVNDVMAADLTTPISVAATYEDVPSRVGFVICSWRWGTSAPRSSASRSAVASRCSSHISSPSAANASRSCRAADWAKR